MSNSVNKNKELIQALSELRSECEAYSSYLDRQTDGQSLPKEDPLNKKKNAVAALIKILGNSEIDDNAKAKQVVEEYDKNKAVFIHKPDEFTTRLFKAIAYVVVSIATGFMFNMGRMAYRWANDSKYVGFSAGFNSEKFMKNIEAKIPKEHQEMLTGDFYENQNHPTGPLGWGGEYADKNHGNNDKSKTKDQSQKRGRSNSF